MKKKFLSLALVLAMALTLLPTTAFAGTSTPKEIDSVEISADKTTVAPGTTVTFTITGAKAGSEDITSVADVLAIDTYSWKLSEGTDTAEKSNTAAAPTAVGTYTVTVTPKVKDGVDDYTLKAGTVKEITITVQKTAITAITVSPATVASEGTVNFTVATVNGKEDATAADAITLGTGTWKTTGDTVEEVTISNNKAPKVTADTNYTVEFTPTVSGNVYELKLANNATKITHTIKVTAGTTDPGGGKTTIGAFTVDPVTMFPVQAGAPVSFKIASASITEGGENKTAAIGKMTLTGASWLLHGSNAPDSTGTLTTAPSTPGTYAITFTATMATNDDFELANDVTYTASGYEVLAASETPTEKPEDANKAPSTNSQGIPVANEVTTAQQATQAVNTLKNTNATVLQDRLMNNDTAFSSFKSLESAVISTKNIHVEVSKESSAPSDVRTGVDIDGAAFNAAASNSTVSLVVGAPSQAYPITAGYQISMSLTGVGNDASLAVPVVITLPIPSDVKPERVVVLHYHDGSSTPSTIIPVVSGSSIRFTVTGFSDFVVTDQSIPTSRTNGGTGYLGGNLKNNQNDISDILPAIAAMLSGDGVFVDVPAEHWAAKEIRWARDGGLMSGYGNGNFGPTASTTRQQLWMVLARLSGTRPADMAEARQWAINTGVSDGSNPSGVLSRQQLVTMLYRFAKSQGVNVSASAKLSGYTDSAKVASYAKEALSWAAAKGIMSGSNGKLNPEGNATRAHFAVFLYRYSNG